MNAVLIRPLPYPRSDALVGVSNRLVIQGQVFEDADLSPAMYAACKENARAFESFGVWTTGAATVTGFGEPEQLVAVTVTQGVLPVLDIQAQIGRWFSAEDDRPGTPETVILSYGYWQRKFSGDPGAIGRTLLVDFIPRQVIGVMPRGFRVGKIPPGYTATAALSRERARGGVQLCGRRTAQARRYAGPGESGCGARVEGMGRNGRGQQNARSAPGATQPAPIEEGRGGGLWFGAHHSDGSARAGAAAGLRQRGEPCACARGIAAARVCDSRGAGRGLGKDRPGTAGGESDVGRAGRRPRSGVCIHRSASAGDTRAGEPSAARGDIARRNGAGVRARVLGRIEYVVWVGGGAAVRQSRANGERTGLDTRGTATAGRTLSW
jgi:hypothetical protein